MYRILSYLKTRNLGDVIQSIALSHLLPAPLQSTFRHLAAKESDHGSRFVVNGWLGDPVPANLDCLFAGVFIGKRIDEHIRWIRHSSYPVGSRDPYTVKMLANHQIESSMIGCATLTFSRYTGKRHGVVNIDSSKCITKEMTVLSNHLDKSVTWEQSWNKAIWQLNAIRSAELVVTKRLHIALPCLAFGTPVVIPRIELNSIHQSERLTLLEYLGFTYDIPNVLDISVQAQHYISFIKNALQDSTIGSSKDYQSSLQEKFAEMGSHASSS